MKSRVAILLLGACCCSAAFASDRDAANIVYAQASTAVQAAEAADAAVDAPIALNDARAHLAAANGALDRRNWDSAAMSAEKARADADLALARAREKRASAALTEIEASVETLRRELERAGG
jgi:hypothetical protein